MFSLQAYLVSRARPGSWLYSAEEFADASELSLLEDIVRERLFVHLQKEIPYVVTQVKAGGEPLLRVLQQDV